MTAAATKLVLFGATGDLSQRMLLPSLAVLAGDGLLPPDLQIIGTARSKLSDSEFRNFARAALEKYLPSNRRGGLADFLNRLSYQELDVTTPEGFAELARSVPSGFSRLIRARSPDSPAPASPLIVASNRLGAVERKIATCSSGRAREASSANPSGVVTSSS